MQLIRNGEGGWVKFRFCKIFFELSFGFDMLPGLALSCDLDGWKAFFDQQVAFSVHLTPLF